MKNLDKRVSKLEYLQENPIKYKVGQVVKHDKKEFIVSNVELIEEVTNYNTGVFFETVHTIYCFYWEYKAVIKGDNTVYNLIDHLKTPKAPTPSYTKIY